MNSSRLASLDFVWRPCISNDSTLRQAFKHSLTHSFSHSLIHRHCKSPFNQSSISARPTLLSHGFLFPFQIHYIDGPHCIQIHIQIQVHSHTYTARTHFTFYLSDCLSVCVCVYVCVCAFSWLPLWEQRAYFYGIRHEASELTHTNTTFFYLYYILIMYICNIRM